MMAIKIRAAISPTAMAQTGAREALPLAGEHLPVLFNKTMPGAQPHVGMPPELTLHWKVGGQLTPWHALGIVVVGGVVDTDTTAADDADADAAIVGLTDGMLSDALVEDGVVETLAAACGVVVPAAPAEVAAAAAVLAIVTEGEEAAGAAVLAAGDEGIVEAPAVMGVVVWTPEVWAPEVWTTEVWITEVWAADVCAPDV